MGLWACYELSLYGAVRLCVKLRVVDEAAASCGESKMSMLLHEVQRLPENKVIAESAVEGDQGRSV